MDERGRKKKGAEMKTHSSVACWLSRKALILSIWCLSIALVLISTTGRSSFPVVEERRWFCPPPAIDVFRPVAVFRFAGTVDLVRFAYVERLPAIVVLLCGFIIKKKFSLNF